MSIPIEKIRRDGGTQSRAAINEATVAEYAEAMADPDTVFPPVVVYFDGKDYWLADGFHRLAAWERIGRTDIPAEVRQGDRRRAILHSVAANAAHGLRRTNEDKRRAVLTLLEDAEWAAWSDREIARRCAVSPSFVGGLRANASVHDGQIEPVRTVERNGTVYQQNTARIGASPKAVAEVQPTVMTSAAPVRPAPVSPVEPDETAQARRELAKLTREGLEDEVIGLRAENAELRAKNNAMRNEIEMLKEDLAAFKQDDLGRALGNAQRAARAAEGRMREYQATAVRADRRVKILEAEVKKLRAEIENQVIPL